MKKALAMFLLGAALASLMGCQSDSTTPAGQAPNRVSSAAERIKAIQNNPNMPPQIKEAAIAQIRAGEAQGKAAKEDAAKQGAAKPK